MLALTSFVPWAAFWTLREISLVVTPCSSTAEAMIEHISDIRPIVPSIALMELTELLVAAWMPEICSLISPVAKVGLAGDGIDQLDHVADTQRRARQLCHMVIGLAGLIDGLAGDVCGLLDLAANLFNRRRHLFGCGRHRLNIGGCLFRGACHYRG